jgi:hypothetical protein
MKNIFTIFITTLAGLQALAKIQIPFAKINLKPSYEIEALVQTPLAVAPVRFASEVLKDCREFALTIRNLKDKSVQIQNSEYDEMRLRALPLSMKPNYQIQLISEKKLNLEPAFEIAKIEDYKLAFSFSGDALSFQSVRDTIHNYIVKQDSTQQDYLVLQFKSRDLFCDYYFGNLKITITSDLQLQTNSLLQTETEKKLLKVLNTLNDAYILSTNQKVQAAYLGASVQSDFKENWQESLKVIFLDLVRKEDLLPLPFWSEKQSDFYSLKLSNLHNILKQNFILKGKFNE